MKIKKRYIFIGLIFLLITLITVFFLEKKELQLIVPFEKNYTEVKVVPKIDISIKESENKNNTIVIPEFKTIKVALNVLGKNYDIEIKEGSSVIDVMKKLEEESINNLFSFKYSDNYSLGSFVTEINGAKGTPGKYWIYYVNGKLASVGVSNYILKDGDIINWNQEGM